MTRHELAVGVEIVRAGGLCAAVERLADPPALSEATLRRQHAIVVALSRATDAILPVRFGALVEPDELAEIVRLRRGVLRRALQRVRGQEQMTLRLFGPAVARVSARHSTTGTEYLRSRVEASRPALTPAARSLVEAVRTLVTAQRIDAGRGAVQLTIHHLVPRGNGPRYARRIASEAVRMAPPPAIAVSGPWPPFAFAPDIWATDDPDSADGPGNGEAWVPA
jgi:hypothetical protein